MSLKPEVVASNVRSARNTSTPVSFLSASRSSGSAKVAISVSAYASALSRAAVAASTATPALRRFQSSPRVSRTFCTCERLARPSRVVSVQVADAARKASSNAPRPKTLTAECVVTSDDALRGKPAVSCVEGTSTTVSCTSVSSCPALAASVCAVISRSYALVAAASAASRVTEVSRAFSFSASTIAASRARRYFLIARIARFLEMVHFSNGLVVV